MVFLTELAPGSSSSSSAHNYNHNRYRYDVFLSFRGEDTRNNFTDHLYNAFLDAGFETFFDDEEIDTGDSLKPELEDAIKSSRASVIVLSENYASSRWCLEELVLILDQKRNFNQIVIPIFYHVDPSHVRQPELDSSIREGMKKHEDRMKGETNSEKRSQLALKIDEWKRALTEVANLKGEDVKNRKETKFIAEIVNDIHRRLGLLLSNSLPFLVGVDDEIRSICSWLADGSCHTADILTIVGINGIGKTSLAKYVFKLHSSKFHKSSFVEDINATCNQKFNGLLDLQKKLYEDISKRTLLQVNDVSMYTSKLKNVVARKKVFIVLDDIGSTYQLNALLGSECLCPGSKVIITTEDASLIDGCALINPKHKKVPLNGLYFSKSLELLCIHAFKRDKPKEGYEDVSEELVEYCDGHPFALKTLGESLAKKDVEYWRGCIRELKGEPNFNINKALRMSFDSLPSKNVKEIFKHIACFFVGTDRDVVETILNACEMNTSFGITNLINRCLIGIGLNNTLVMHQLVQEMGRDVVRQESPKLWKRSRLWCPNESFEVLQMEKSKKNVLGLAFDMTMLDKKKSRGPFELKKKLIK